MSQGMQLYKAGKCIPPSSLCRELALLPPWFQPSEAQFGL